MQDPCSGLRMDVWIDGGKAFICASDRSGHMRSLYVIEPVLSTFIPVLSTNIQA